MTMKLVRSALIAGVIAVSSASMASINQINAFSGILHESWDEFPTQQEQLFLPNPTPTFGHHATVTTTGDFPALAVYNPPTNPFGDYKPVDGDFFAVTQNTGDRIRIDFDQPVSQFGGYWGQDPIRVEFFDAAGASVGAGDYTPDLSTDGTLKWLGWSSTLAFTSVQVDCVNSMVFDSMEASPVPEPLSMVALGCGIVVLSKKRRS